MIRTPASASSPGSRCPRILPRLLDIDPTRFVPIDQVIEANLADLFMGMEVVEAHLFRVTRNADFTVEEDEADDLLMAIEEELRRRRFGEAVRLEVERTMPAGTRNLLMRGIGLEPDDVYEVAGMLDLTALYRIADLDGRTSSRSPGRRSRRPPRAPRRGRTDGRVRRHARRGHPRPPPLRVVRRSVEHFIEQAADDPDVLTIKQTLYRTAVDSPIVQRAHPRRRTGKQVVVLVEIKARFDEEANIVWARAWNAPGPTSSTAWSGSRRTPRLPSSSGARARAAPLCPHRDGQLQPQDGPSVRGPGAADGRPGVGADVTDLFNVLTGLSRSGTFRRLLVAPHNLRQGSSDLIDRERAHAEAGRPARIVVKTNAVVDVPVIEALYAPRTAGCPDRPHRARRVLAAAGCPGRLARTSASARSSAIPGALADLGVRQPAATRSGTSARRT